MNNTGIHIRLTKTLTDIIEKAVRLNLPFFQTFLTFQDGKHIRLDPSDVKNFLNLRQKFTNLYLHGSYWINLCLPVSNSYAILEKEILMAKRLQFTHLILHPGSATKCKDKMEGIDNLASSLNKILKKEKDVSIVLENTAHGNLSIGGDINDFEIILNKIDSPERILFCIDTAHAYSYGYDISNFQEQENFINLIKSIINPDKISLIHLNDTSEILGKKIDKHNIPGQGNIGKQALINFLKNEIFINIPRIIEFPNLSEQEEINNYQEIKKW